MTEKCDGLTELFMITMKIVIPSYFDENQRNWDLHLDLFTFAYNTASHATIKSFYMIIVSQKYHFYEAIGLKKLKLLFFILYRMHGLYFHKNFFFHMQIFNFLI
jgi:hypothetical protein